jgi:antimicrobial peptide system SdpA family protein
MAFAWLPVSDVAPAEVRRFSQGIRSATVQGWAFFTRDPQEEVVLPYRDRDGDGTWENASEWPNAQARHAFGFDRTGRSTQFDTQVIAASVPEAAWTACDDPDLAACIEGFGVALPVSVLGDVRLCGRIALVSRRPVPWEYRRLVEAMPGKVAVVNVACRL